MSSVKLPNVRKMFIPDPGYVIFDCDLSGADAQVVAWDANDADLKAAFRAGMKIHIKNFEDMYNTPFDPKIHKHPQPGHIYSVYDEMKRAVHATNYGGSARTIAITLGWKIAEAERFQQRWFIIHPSIRDWHRRKEFEIQTTRSVSNAFGYRIMFFDRADNLLPRALAWTPQSTVGLVASRGACNLHRTIPWLHVLLQVHDSVVFQVPIHRATSGTLALIRQLLTVPVPYPDPLIIPWSIAASSKSWGDVKEIKWTGEGLDECRNTTTQLETVR